MAPEIKSDREKELMQFACRTVAGGLDLAERNIAPGISTGEIDRIITEFVLAKGGTMAFKNYRGFPGNVCISVNEEVVHGIPGKRKLKDGDIVSIDVGVKYKNYFGDSARTFAVGTVSGTARRVMNVCKEALAKAIEQARPGNRLGDVCRVIQTFVESEGLEVVRQYVGHGIGRRLHEDPQIPNYVTGSYDMNLVLRRGMALAIEPMVNEGTGQTRELANRWTVVTADGKLSAHFEHTVWVGDSGPEILTKN